MEDGKRTPMLARDAVVGRAKDGGFWLLGLSTLELSTVDALAFFWASRRSQITPLGAWGVARTSLTSVDTIPTEVAACRKRRFGNVWHGAEQNHRSQSGNVFARPQ